MPECRVQSIFALACQQDHLQSLLGGRSSCLLILDILEDWNILQQMAAGVQAMTKSNPACSQGYKGTQMNCWMEVMATEESLLKPVKAAQQYRQDKGCTLRRVLREPSSRPELTRRRVLRSLRCFSANLHSIHQQSQMLTLTPEPTEQEGVFLSFVHGTSQSACPWLDTSNKATTCEALWSFDADLQHTFNFRNCNRPTGNWQETERSPPNLVLAMTF